VQRLRPYHESELNLQVHPEAPEGNREKVPSPEPDPEDVELDDYHRLVLAASTVALLGKKLQLRDDRQRTNSTVTAEGMIRETGGAAELPETLETAGNRHWPLHSEESLSKDLLLTSEGSGDPQLLETVDVGERPHQEETMHQNSGTPAETVMNNTEPYGGGLIESSAQPSQPTDEQLNVAAPGAVSRVAKDVTQSGPTLQPGVRMEMRVESQLVPQEEQLGSQPSVVELLPSSVRREESESHEVQEGVTDPTVFTV